MGTLITILNSVLDSAFFKSLASALVETVNERISRRSTAEESNTDPDEDARLLNEIEHEREEGKLP